MGKLKLLIADDEQLVIEDIKNLLDWQKLNIEIIGQALNGKSAMNLFLKHRPEIVITDIRMPIMDGLKLSQQILAIDPTVKIILLTAYKDFEYAKQAISLGISQYLLKNDINEISLYEKIKVIQKELSNQESTRRIIIREKLKHVLQIGTDIEDINPLDDILKSELALFLIQLDEDFYILEKEDKQSIILKCKNDFLESISEYISCSFAEIIRLEYNQCMIVISTPEMHSYSKKQEILFKVALVIQEKYKLLYDQDISILIGIETEKNNYGFLFQDIMRCAKYKIFFGMHKIIWLRDILNKYGLIDEDVQFVFTNLEKEFKSGNQEKVTEEIKSLFKYFYQFKWNLRALNNLCTQLIYIFNSLCKDYYRINFNFIYEKECRGNMPSRDLDQIADIFIKIYQIGLNYIDNHNNDKYSKKVQQCLQYIYKNYDKDITVDNVGEYLNISGVYLSQLLKKDLGKTFLECLTEYRIQIAKQYLDSSDYKMYEIANKIGYKTSQYFSHVFKKITGQSPFEYKERKK
jgi:two-component system response regulator YesN